MSVGFLLEVSLVCSSLILGVSPESGVHLESRDTDGVQLGCSEVIQVGRVEGYITPYQNCCLVKTLPEKPIGIKTGRRKKSTTTPPNDYTSSEFLYQFKNYEL